MKKTVWMKIRMRLWNTKDQTAEELRNCKSKKNSVIYMLTIFTIIISLSILTRLTISDFQTENLPELLTEDTFCTLLSL